MPLIFRQTTIRGIAVAPRSSFDCMNPFFFNQHNIKPVIEQIYSFNEAVETFKHLSRGAFGKIVIKIGD